MVGNTPVGLPYEGALTSHTKPKGTGGGLVPPKQETGRVIIQSSIGLPQDLWDRVDRLAAAKGYSRSEYLRLLIGAAVDQDEAAGS